MIKTHPLKLPTAILFFTIFFFSSLPQRAAAEKIPLNIPETDHSTTVSKSEIEASLETVSEIFNNTYEVGVTKDVDSAAIVKTDEGVVDIPKNPEEGITLALVDMPKIDIQLPNAVLAQDANTIAPGVVAYPAGNGSANAVQANEDGTVRMLTIIDNANAPTEYPYTITVPDGGSVKLSYEGGALIVDSSDQVIAAVDIPWAKDAAGNSVKTWFTSDGKTLTQHIEHNANGVVYPVNADPWIRRWFGYEFQLTRNQTNNVMLGMGGATAASFVIPDGTVSKIFGALLAWSTGYANWIYNRGGCLKVAVSYIGQGWTSDYYGGNCR